MSAPAVLLMDCPPELRQPLNRALLDADMLPADTARVGPDVILIWLDVHDVGAEQRLEQLRADHRRSAPAIIGVGSAHEVAALARAARIGLDDYAQTDDAVLLAARAALVYRSRTRFAQASPLTGLPGVGALSREIERRLPQRGQMALLAFDADYFKSYNDRYGYERGDALLRHLWIVIEQALSQCAARGHFLAHLGGDDFFAIVTPPEAPAVAQRAIELFEATRAGYYDPDDLARGCVVTRSRSGELAATPLVTLTVASVTNEAEDLQHTGQLSAILAELKAYGKSLAGSNYVPDRRRIHDNDAAWASRQLGDTDEP